MPDFAYPLVLWLLPILLGGVLWRWFSRPATVAVSSAEHFTNGVEARKHFTSRHLLLLMEALAATAFILALARPQSDVELMPITKEGTDIMIALDYSNSMDAVDHEEGLSDFAVKQGVRDGIIKDRLGVARDQISRFVQRRSHDRIGLVVFGVDAYTACPPTLDHDFLVSQTALLDNSLLNMKDRGTNIGAGLGASINALVNHSESKRTIILITDGDNTVDDEVFTPTEAPSASAVTIPTSPSISSKWEPQFASILAPLKRLPALETGVFSEPKIIKDSRK